MPLQKTASLRHLGTFQVVARLGSVSLAAEELHLSQSAVSIQIASLETSVGAPLIERTGRGVRLTEAGELLVVYADRLLNLWTEASDEMSTFLGDFSGTLRVGAVTTAEYWLPRLLVTFVNANPRVKLKLLIGNREEVVRSMSAQDVDIVVMGQPPDELRVIAASFAKNPMGFVASPHHPLSTEPTVTMAEVAQAQLLVRERGSGTRNTVERMFRDAGMRPRIGSELSSNEAIKQMCVAGFGPAFLSLHTCRLEVEAGLLKMLPMQDNPVEREWFMVRAAARPPTQVVLAFEQFLREHGREEIIHRGNGSAVLEARPVLM